MRSLRSFFWITLVWSFLLYVKGVEVRMQYAINDSRIRDSCMVDTDNFNRSCMYHKIAYLFEKLFVVSGWTISHMSPFELVKLPEYATSITSAIEVLPSSRSFSKNFVSIASKTMEYFLDSYGIKISLPPLSRSGPGIIVDNFSNDTQRDEGRHKKKMQKRFALVFPLIATFKFILIKALLIPILLGIMAIKKMLVMTAMAIPAIVAMLRICRVGPFGGGGLGGLIGTGGFTAAAAAPLMTAPYVASDTIIGDFSNYAPAAMSAHQAYHNKQQEYVGKSFPPMSGYNSGIY